MPSELELEQQEKQISAQLDNESLSGINMSKEMREIFQKMKQALNDSYTNVSQDLTIKYRYFFKENSTNEYIVSTLGNIINEFIEDPSKKQIIYVENDSTKQKVLDTTAKYLASLNAAEIKQLHTHFVKNELPSMYMKTSNDFKGIEKFSIDLMKKNVSEFLEKHSPDFVKDIDVNNQKTKKNNIS